jgi:uncharacterized membrane protein (UPF0127 family)
MTLKSRLILLAPLLLLLLVGCHKDAVASNLPMVQVPIGSKTFTLEVAAREGDRNKGLMYRDFMPEDRGMIFVFGEVKDVSFWMKNTRIPLDILFVDPSGKVISIRQMKPYVEFPGTPSGGAIKYAIELNSGEAGKAGAKVGDVLVIPEAAKNASADP